MFSIFIATKLKIHFHDHYFLPKIQFQKPLIFHNKLILSSYQSFRIFLLLLVIVQ